jgi:hypothetical protein
LLSITAVVGIYEIVSTLLDFQFTTTIAHYLDGEDIGRQFSTVFAITNWGLDVRAAISDGINHDTNGRCLPP